MPFSNVYEFTFHEQKLIIKKEFEIKLVFSVWMLFYMKLFTSELLNYVNLKQIYGVNIHFFTVFRITTRNGCNVCLPVSGCCFECNCLHPVR